MLDVLKQRIIKRKPLAFVFFVFLFFLLFSAFWNTGVFPSDEEEIFVKGNQIAHGQLLYKEIGSQHMPLMYFFSALFSLLGVNTIVGYRLCFYALVAIIWSSMLILYIDRIDFFVLITFPICYLGILPLVSCGNTILSEQIQAQSMVILLFELLLYYRNDRNIQCKSNYIISAAIFLSFGVSFASIFGLFFAGCTVLFLDIRAICSKRKEEKKKEIREIIHKYTKLAGIICIPWLLFLIYFLITNSLSDLISWAYRLNRVVYPKYYEGQYGSGLLYALFGGISNFGLSFSDTINFKSISIFLVVLFSTLFFLSHYRKYRDIVFILLLLLFVVGVSSRGSFNTFHGLPSCAVLCACSLLFFSLENIRIIKKQLKIILLACIIIFFSSYLSIFSNIFRIDINTVVPTDKALQPQRKAEAFIDDITEDNEKVGFSLLSYDILINSHVMPASITGGSCIWMWEWGGKQAIKELEECPPRVFLFDEKLDVAGYSIVEYAPELCEFLTKNYVKYTGIEGVEYIYLRNDVFSDIYYLKTGEDGYPNLVNLTPNMIVKQYFTAEGDDIVQQIIVKIGKYKKLNKCTIDVKILDVTNSEVLDTKLIKGVSISDSSYIKMNNKSINLKKNHQYCIILSSSDATTEDYLGIFYDSYFAKEGTYCLANEEKQSYNLTMEIVVTRLPNP